MGRRSCSSLNMLQTLSFFLHSTTITLDTVVRYDLPTRTRILRSLKRHGDPLKRILKAYPVLISRIDSQISNCMLSRATDSALYWNCFNIITQMILVSLLKSIHCLVTVLCILYRNRVLRTSENEDKIPSLQLELLFLTTFKNNINEEKRFHDFQNFPE